MASYKKIFLHSWGRYLISFLFGITILVIFNSIRTWDAIINYIDAFFIAGFALLCIGVMSVLNYFGAFDMFSHLFAKPNEQKVKPSYYEYSKSMAIKRKEHKYNFVPYVMVGMLYILLSIILYLAM